MDKNQMKEETIVKESPHSVKFSINAKGFWSGECKVYADTPDNAMKEANRIAKELEAIIIQKNKLEV